MLPPPASIRLFEDEHVEVLFRPGSTSYTLATFSNFGFKADGTTFWGRQLCEANDIECLGFVAKKSNWFPHSSMVAAAAAAKVSSKPLISYGHSQGGYAAIKYAAVLGAAGVIAGSPQFSIDPTIVADHRFTPYFNPSLNNGMEIATLDFCGRVVLIYDPLDPGDCEHAKKIQEQGYEDTTHLAVYHLGHETMEVLQKKELLFGLVDYCLGKGNQLTIFNQARHLKKSSVRYSIKLAEGLLKKNKPLIAQNLLDAVLKRAGGHIHSRDRAGRAFTSALAYKAMCQLEDAFKQVLVAQHAEPDSPQVQAKVGDFLLMLGDASRAVDAYRRATQLQPTATYFKKQLQRAMQLTEGGAS